MMKKTGQKLKKQSKKIEHQIGKDFLNKPLVLDSGPLGRIAHPKRNPEIQQWFNNILDLDIKIYIPEIADYEVRRSFILENLQKSLLRLNDLNRVLYYLPITTKIMLQAAELWAQARKIGKPTADPKELDGDAILAAQALEIDGIVITENVGHLSNFVKAINWKDFNL